MQPSLSTSRAYWHGSKIRFRRAVDGVRGEPVMLTTSDRADVRGIYWTPAANPHPKVAVVATHPRSDFSFHHAFPDLLDAGYACLGANMRTVNNDMDCQHESLLLDVAAWLRWLRGERGVERIVLLGNSGGGSLFAFYQAQAKAAPAQRHAASPGGRPVPLPAEDMPVADAMIFMAAHTGQGLIVAGTIDPAVVDEHDPLRSNPALDMYDPRNGFRPPPQWTEYDEDFITRYRAAQRERVLRLDARARAMIDDARDAASIRDGEAFESLPATARRAIEARAAFSPVMVIYRTMANLNYVDRRLDPSNRGYGCLFGERPDTMNFALRGFARVVTPHGWLSTWSGLSSRANVPANAPAITEPSLVINAGRDLDVYPDTHSRRTFDALSSPDKTYWEFPDALHYFEPAHEGDGNRALDELMSRLLPWLEERAPL